MRFLPLGATFVFSTLIQSSSSCGSPSAFALSAEGLDLETKLWGEMSEVWVKTASEVAEVLKV